jgi:2-iminobutanoate/2-iminopropanoate deaminase
MKKPIATDRAPKPGPYSQGVLAGDTLYVSAVGPVDPGTGQMVGDTVEEQAARTIENIRAIVEAAGGGLDDVVKVTAFLSDLAHFPKFNEVYQRYFKPPFPARSTFQVVLSRWMIAMDAVAYLGKGDGGNP